MELHAVEPRGQRVARGLREVLDDTANLGGLERARLVEILQSVAGNKQAAARTLGISTRALYRRLERYGLHTASPAAPPPAV